MPASDLKCRRYALQIDGMRMDLVKPRYETFDELYEYCYKVAGTVGLMTTPVMGVDPSYKVLEFFLLQGFPCCIQQMLYAKRCP